MTAGNIVYLPRLAGGRVVQSFRFRAASGPYCCALVTDCRTEESPEYTHVLFVHRGLGLFGRACFAVAAEVNRSAPPGSGRSHFLGVFHGADGPTHENLGSSDDWADLKTFTAKAMEIVVEHFTPLSPPTELGLSNDLVRYYNLPRTHVLPSDLIPPALDSLKSKGAGRNRALAALGTIASALVSILVLVFIVVTGLALVLSTYLAIAYRNRDTLIFLGGSLVCVVAAVGIGMWLSRRTRRSGR